MRACRGGEADGGGGVVYVGDGWVGGEEGEACGGGLGALVVELGAVRGVEGGVEGDVVVALVDDQSWVMQ